MMTYRQPHHLATARPPHRLIRTACSLILDRIIAQLDDPALPVDRRCALRREKYRYEQQCQALYGRAQRTEQPAQLWLFDMLPGGQ